MSWRLFPRAVAAMKRVPATRLAAPFAAVGLVVGALVLLLLRNCGRGPWPTRGPASLDRPCQRRTTSGICVEEFFAAVDDAYRPQWPGSVDLLVRTHISDKSFLLQTLLLSAELMWPRGLGDCVLVLDQGEEAALGLLPSWVKVYFEENHLQLPGKFLQQWSYGWADKYTTADFVAIIDDDVIFSIKVTPPLLFNMSSGQPWVIGSARHQRRVWAQWSEFLVGRGKYTANFMAQLPFVVPRAAFAAFRDHVGRLHPTKGGSYDSAFRWFSRHAKPFGRDQIQHAALGNFLHHFYNTQVSVVLEWSEHVPIPRVGTHIPWTMKFYAGTNYTDYSPKVTGLYVDVAASFAHQGLCCSFPEGALPGCEGVERTQEQVWKYALDWNDWPLMFKKGDPAAAEMYDRHLEEMYCMYGVMTARKRNVPPDVTQLRKCLHVHTLKHTP